VVKVDEGHLSDPPVFKTTEGEARHLLTERTYSRLVVVYTGRLGELAPGHDLGTIREVILCKVHSAVGSREARG
jgi:hypothetical protein